MGRQMLENIFTLLCMLFSTADFHYNHLLIFLSPPFDSYISMHYMFSSNKKENYYGSRFVTHS